MLIALPAPATAAELPASLLGGCLLRDAADGNVGNGVTLPFRFCDDGVPNTGGRTPNEGAALAVAVPARYEGVAGLPAKHADADDVPGADTNGDVAIDVDVSLPDPTLHPMPPDGYPLVAMMHGCCGGNKTGWEATSVDAGGEKWHYSNAWFAARGYVVLTYTSRGFVTPAPTPEDPDRERGSTGETQLNHTAYEINDFQALAARIADTEDLDPAPDREVRVDPSKVVTTGGSYGGGFAWLTLTDPTWTSDEGRAMSLAAAAPRYGWTDLIYSLVPNGHDLRDVMAPSDPDNAFSARPFGFPKRSIDAALYASGRTGIPPGTGSRTTFPRSIDEAMVCLQSSDPFEDNPLCASSIRDTLPEFVRYRSAYHQREFFDRLAAGDPAARVPVFSAGAFSDALFPSHEHRRMAERLKATSPGYPIQEYYGDYQHFVQNKPKEWGDLCGDDRHVCRLSDYPDGDPGGEAPSLRSLGVTTRLNRFLEHHVRPPANTDEPEPANDVTASLQVCPQNATAANPVNEPGTQFTASSFDALAPNTLRVTAEARQVTTSNAEPNHHALNSEPIVNQQRNNGGACPVETQPAGPGVATYDSQPLAADFTMIGRTRVIAKRALTQGRGIQLNARLYDVFPDGTAVMVDRGVRRVDDAEAARGTTTFDLHGNGWRFPAGHRIRVELAQDDDPFVKSSVQPSGIVLDGVELLLPVREASAGVGGSAGPGEDEDEDGDDGGSNDGGSGDGGGGGDGGSGGAVTTVGGGAATASASLMPNAAPRLDRLSVRPARFRVASKRQALRSGAPRGATIRFTLSEPASTSLGVFRLERGQRAGGRCVRPRPVLRPACVRRVAAGGLARRGVPGANRVEFSGRLAGGALPPGDYVLRVVARDAAGASSLVRWARFRVLPG